MPIKSYQQIEQARALVPRVLFIISEDKSASWQWRVAWPAEALAAHGYIADWCLAHNAPTILGLINAGRYNVVITPRISWPNESMAGEWAALVHDSGLKWLYEVDDNGWAPDIASRQASLFMVEWQKGEYQLEQDRAERINTIQQSDAVIVSSPILGDIAGRYTRKPVFCVPNFINHGFFLDKVAQSKRMIPPLTVGWSGGVRNADDLEHVAEAWSIIAAKYPKVNFVVHGVRMPILLDAVPPERATCLAWSSLPDYPRALMNIDIACCAVAAGNEFNESKTPIKWMETSLSGATCVVSNALYGRYVRDGKDALVAETTQEWVDAISKLIDNASLRRRIQKNARAKVLAEHTLEGNWHRWIEVLATVLDPVRTNGLVHA